jgi:hypothetical protein
MMEVFWTSLYRVAVVRTDVSEEHRLHLQGNKTLQRITDKLDCGMPLKEFIFVVHIEAYSHYELGKFKGFMP